MTNPPAPRFQPETTSISGDPRGAAPQSVPESAPPRATPRTLLVWAITAINVAVFLAMELSGGSTNTRVLVQFGAKVNQLIAQGEYWRIVAPIFLHIGLMH